jgi:hypothetical protein
MSSREAVEDGGDVGLGMIRAVQLRRLRDGVDDRGPLPASIATDEQIGAMTVRPGRVPVRESKFG